MKTANVDAICNISRKLITIQNLGFHVEKSGLLTHYSQVFLYITPENIKKPLGFLIFSGVIDMQHRAVMG